ncbi:hypothetical protein HanIR_Chr11g0525201 [Helianthus annuus]|nr:hypothetical protein HanIR_Chr11g0525201 [Helianthus annuus]
MTCTRPCYHNPTLPRNLHNHTVNAHYTTGVVPTNPAVAARIRDHKYHVYVMLRLDTCVQQSCHIITV